MSTDEFIRVEATLTVSILDESATETIAWLLDPDGDPKEAAHISMKLLNDVLQRVSLKVADAVAP